MTSVSFDVPIIDDGEPENKEVFFILLQVNSLPAGIQCGQSLSAKVTISG